MRTAHHFTIDLEEYFQVSAFEGRVPRSDWGRLESRVEGQVALLLDLLARHEARATVFALGWLAERQVALIQAHPDLAGKAAIAGELTAESAHEQSSAGLSRLAPEEFATFTRLNHAYRERFGFPFVICAREHNATSILEHFAARLEHTRTQEIDTALGEIAKIARLRLLDVVQPQGA